LMIVSLIELILKLVNLEIRDALPEEKLHESLICYQLLIALDFVLGYAFLKTMLITH
jgi:hypothetical protein